ncbi:MFS transporter [Galbitalea sp. SE-J8]|uniref:MFS transporter n=1 Tax=Galbitalea sp. SE-J8 TaxID=3054952 RepID=UPI00259CC307|nr:MFS transporter [Galbitalea sp. SE-J8]MDM4763417.1 MFS transporter [Galbitalea sp. SE-J8]
MSTPAASTPAARPAASSAGLFQEPIRRVPARWITLFATAWFGIWMAQLTPIQLLLPNQIAEAFHLPLDPEQQLSTENWLDPVMAFGVISAIAGACALLAYPLTGALSDRTTSRFGRRRPWILAGTLVFAVSLVLLGLQTGLVGIGVFWATTLVGFCMVTAAITATISDQVPINQRGFVSGWVSAPQAVGTLAGLALVDALALSTLVGYLVVAIALVVLVVPFLVVLRDPALPASERPPFAARAILAGFWVSPRRHPDFGWTLLSRILVNLGNALGTTQLIYFLAFGLHSAHVVDDLLLLTAVYMAFFIVAALVVGRISDRIGQRKIFVYIASYLIAIAALLLAFVPALNVAIVGAGILGLGYGAYMAVDQALATQVLPDAHARGKDLGIMNIALAVPQAVGPLLGAVLVVGFAGLVGSNGGQLVGDTFVGAGTGFAALFVASAIASVLGGFALIPIRSVK